MMSGSLHVGRECGPAQVLQSGAHMDDLGASALPAGYWGQAVWPALAQLLHTGWDKRHGGCRANNRRVKRLGAYESDW
jgi:hypothetical protein